MMFVLMGSIASGIMGFQLYKSFKIKEFMKKNSEIPVTVSAEQIKFQEWQPQIKATGTLIADQGSEIVPEVSGMVEKVYFNSGDYVKAGDLLLDLKSDVERAQLESLKAQVEIAKITYKRDQEQMKAQALSQAKVDEDFYDLKDKQAQQKEIEAVLDKKRIRAPFKGRLGICNLNVGDYLNVGDEIVTLQDTSKLLINFSLPQQKISEVKIGQKLQMRFDGYPDQVFSGKVTSINPKVDLDTRSVLIEARVESSSTDLLPGFFCSIELYIDSPKFFLTLPQTALEFNPYGTLVYVIQERDHDEKIPQKIAVQRFVTVGDKRGDQVAIIKGLKEGEWIVTGGQMKLKNKTPVEINNTVVPSNESLVYTQDQ